LLQQKKENKMKRISMVGLGYIGLPTAAVMADHGLDVIGVDISQSVCDTINQGRIHIVEPGLEEMVRRVVEKGQLVATTQVEPADVFVIAVPTPFTEGFVPDVTYVRKACEALAEVLEPGNLVILESTSPVGTTDNMANWLRTQRPDLVFPESGSVNEPDVHIAYCPERVLPGNVINELIRNDRAIGGMTTSCADKAQAFYQQFVRGECVTTQARTAEMAKLTENSYRDVNIAFANELSMICDKLDIPVWELIALTNRHPRVNVLQPGCGVGGHCIAVDPWFIVNSAPEEAKLIRQAREVNDFKPEWVVQKVVQLVGQYLLEHPDKRANDLTIACFGLAFKPNIDDLRESPAMKISTLIAERFAAADVVVVEPNIDALPPQSALAKNGARLIPQAQALQADVSIVLVAHDEFKAEPALAGQPYIHNVAWG
jgi:UDP-N-acetyl-D-mannosaminuronic acid dehydrogenase